jgi:hypothetical protein
LQHCKASLYTLPFPSSPRRGAAHRAAGWSCRGGRAGRPARIHEHPVLRSTRPSRLLRATPRRTVATVQAFLRTISK